MTPPPGQPIFPSPLRLVSALFCRPKAKGAQPGRKATVGSILSPVLTNHPWAEQCLGILGCGIRMFLIVASSGGCTGPAGPTCPTDPIPRLKLHRLHPKDLAPEPDRAL